MMASLCALHRAHRLPVEMFCVVHSEKDKDTTGPSRVRTRHLEEPALLAHQES